MNDIEFAGLISDDIGKDYERAKEIAQDNPEYCLVLLRSVGKQACLKIKEACSMALPKDLDDAATLTKEFFERGLLDKPARKDFNDLRIAGNQGAHPEKRLTLTQYSSLARSSLEAVRRVLEHTYVLIFPGSVVPDYAITPPEGSYLKLLCYRATIEDDAESQYLLGRHFTLSAEGMERNAREEAMAHGFSMLGERHATALEKARFWFKLGAGQDHAPSMYEYGSVLVSDSADEGQIKLGIGTIFRAAARGNVDANVFAGRVLYEGLHGFDQDFSEARNHFVLAAKEDHPAALMHLGVMFLRGEGGPKNPAAAFECTRKSAEAGYPTGQFNLFAHYFNGDFVERDEELALDWLQKSADQMLPVAMYHSADLILAGRFKEKTSSDAENLLRACIGASIADKENSSKACFRLASLLSETDDDIHSLVESASLLQRCYEQENGTGELADCCKSASPRVISTLENLIKKEGARHDELNKVILIRQLFDANGFPYLKKSEANRAYAKALQEANQHTKNMLPELRRDCLASLLAPRLMIQRKAQHVSPVMPNYANVGRNDPCPCGSGKKFKRCCSKE